VFNMDYDNGIFSNGSKIYVTLIHKYSDGPLDTKNYYNGHSIGTFPDLSLKVIDKIKGGAKKAHKNWNTLEREDKVDKLIQTGDYLEKNNSYDTLISQAGGFPIKKIAGARGDMARYLNASGELLKNCPGRGPVIAATSVTTPHVQPYVIVEALLGNCSITIKGDRDEPYSAYMLSKIGDEIGLPIQFISYDPSKKANFASELYKDLCVKCGGHFVLMGDRKTPLKIAYPNLMAKLRDDSEAIAELQIPEKMIAFTDHGAVLVVDGSADVQDAVKTTLDSYSFPMACKTPVAVLVDESIKGEYTSKLIDALKKLKVGDVTDYETDIAKITDDQWDSLVAPFIRTAQGGGNKIIYGGEKHQPMVIDGYFDDTFSMEPHWPTICLETVPNIEAALEKINQFAKNDSRSKFLELGVCYKSPEVIQKIDSLRKKDQLCVHTIHENLPTMSVSPLVGHENVILRDRFAGVRYMDKAD
jgi:acyl-CoA reductase-like NAD-dependent aldehyde dehydrogenase